MKKILSILSLLFFITVFAYASYYVNFNVTGNYTSTATVLKVPTVQITVVPNPALVNPFPGNLVSVIGGSAVTQEQVLVTGVNTTNSSVTVVRGYNGTTAQPLYSNIFYYINATVQLTTTPIPTSTPTATNTPTATGTITPIPTNTPTVTPTITPSVITQGKLVMSNGSGTVFGLTGVTSTSVAVISMESGGTQTGVLKVSCGIGTLTVVSTSGTDSGIIDYFIKP
jgi:hypothetical protein